MNNPTSIIPAKTRVRRKRRNGSPTATPVVNQIINVTLGAVTGQVHVKLSAVLTGFDDIDKMLGLSPDGDNWVYPIDLEGDDEGNVTFIFVGDVTDCSVWRVPGPGNYHFADDQPLVEPFNGSIESI